MRIGAIVVAAAFALGAADAAVGDINSGASGGALAIALPHDGDEYSTLVARAATQDKTVDFRELRLSYLKSVARKNRKVDTNALKDALFAAVKSGDDTGVRDAAIKLLSANYTDMYGHKFLRQACEHLHDDGCAQQSHFVEFGMLDSIMASGDGKSCDTGWEVADIAEEYFIIAIQGDTPAGQALVQGKHGPCDLLHVMDQNSKPQDYYFRIDAVFADEMSSLGGH